MKQFISNLLVTMILPVLALGSPFMDRAKKIVDTEWKALPVTIELKYSQDLMIKNGIINEHLKLFNEFLSKIDKQQEVINNNLKEIESYFNQEISRNNFIELLKKRSTFSQEQSRMRDFIEDSRRTARNIFNVTKLRENYCEVTSSKFTKGSTGLAPTNVFEGVVPAYTHYGSKQNGGMRNSFSSYSDDPKAEVWGVLAYTTVTMAGIIALALINNIAISAVITGTIQMVTPMITMAVPMLAPITILATVAATVIAGWLTRKSNAERKREAERKYEKQMREFEKAKEYVNSQIPQQSDLISRARDLCNNENSIRSLRDQFASQALTIERDLGKELVKLDQFESQVLLLGKNVYGAIEEYEEALVKIGASKLLQATLEKMLSLEKVGWAIRYYNTYVKKLLGEARVFRAENSENCDELRSYFSQTFLNLDRAKEQIMQIKDEQNQNNPNFLAVINAIDRNKTFYLKTLGECRPFPTSDLFFFGANL